MSSTKIDALKPEQEQQLVAFRQRWLDIGRATGPAKLEAVRPVLNDWYSCLGHGAPYIWHCQSPMQAQIIINLLKSGLGANLSGNLRANLWHNLGDNLSANLRHNLGANVWANLMAGRADALDVDLTYHATWVDGSYDAYWIAYYLFPHLYLRPMHTDEQIALLNQWATVAQNSGIIYTFEHIAFVCDRPTHYNLDERGRLHSTTEAAMQFADGYALYYVHGVGVPSDIIKDHSTITVDRIYAEPNTEVRRVMIELYGQDRYICDSNARLINEDVDQLGHPRKLWRASFDDDEPLVMVELVNSTPEPDGTHKTYWLRVPPTTRTAHEAVAWSFGLPADDYVLEAET